MRFASLFSAMALAPAFPLLVYVVGLARFSEGYPMEVLAFQITTVLLVLPLAARLRKGAPSPPMTGSDRPRSGWMATALSSRPVVWLLLGSIVVIVLGYLPRMPYVLSGDFLEVRQMHWAGEGQNFTLLKVWSAINIIALFVVCRRLVVAEVLWPRDILAAVLLLFAALLDSLFTGGKHEAVTTGLLLLVVLAWRRRAEPVPRWVLLSGGAMVVFVIGTHFLRLDFLQEYIAKFSGRLMEPGPTFDALAAWVDPLILVKVLEPLFYFLDGIVAYTLTVTVAAAGALHDYWLLTLRPLGAVASLAGLGQHQVTGEFLSRQFGAYGIGENPWVPLYTSFSVYLPGMMAVLAFAVFEGIIALRAFQGLRFGQPPGRVVESLFWFVFLVLGTYFNPFYVPFFGNILLALLAMNVMGSMLRTVGTSH